MRDRASARSWTVRLLVALVVVALLAVVGGATYRWAHREPARVEVAVDTGDRRRAVTVDDGAPVAEALLEAGVVPRAGRLRSAGTGTVIDAAADPAQLTVDGHAARADTRLAAGVVVGVVDGTDRVEDTREVTGSVAADPLPDVLRHVQVTGVAGVAVQVVGVDSGEVVSSKMTRAPVQPHVARAKVVALTFDDGPTTEWTPQILAVLRAKGVKATFCEVGDNVARHPELSRQVVAEGHRLCNHTLAHDEHLRGAGQTVLDQQIGGGRDAITDAGLDAPAWFRPPGGFLDDGIEATARRAGEVVVTWTVDTEDWKRGANYLTIFDKLFRQVEPGAIILMHDGGGTDRSATVASLGPMIDTLRAQGYRFTFPTMAPGDPTT